MKTKQTPDYMRPTGKPVSVSKFLQDYDRAKQAQGNTCPAGAGHSTLPWFTMASTNPDELHPMVSVWAGSETRESIVCNSCSPSDAAFIVRACNNAQRLADALREVLDGPDKDKDAAEATAHAALAQWEGDKQ